jgi:hypothetical protein
MPSTGFEPAIPAGERPQAYVLDRAAKLYSKSYLTVSHFKRPGRKAHYSPASIKFLPTQRAV